MLCLLPNLKQRVEMKKKFRDKVLMEEIKRSPPPNLER